MSDNVVPQLQNLEFYFDCELCGAHQVLSIYVEDVDPEAVAAHMSHLLEPICYGCFRDIQIAKHTAETSQWERENGLSN